MWGTLDDREREAREALLSLIAAGRVVDAESLGQALGCSPAASSQLLDALAAKGFVVRDGAHGGIAAAYPLSTRPTRHRVTLADGRTAYALCAVDALGVSPLLRASAAIETRCPHCEQPIGLEVHEGEVRRREPPTAVLWYSMADLLEKRVEGLNLSAEH